MTPLQTSLFVQLRAFILLVLAADYPAVEVVRGQGNKVPMPAGPFVLITETGLVALAQTQTKYGGLGQTMEMSAPMEWRIGVDCYGPNSQDWAATLATVLRTSYACEQMTTLSPQYAGDATQFPLVDGEAQYEARWRFDAVMQYTPVVSLAQQSAISLDLDVVSVDAIYPPGA